MGANKKIQTAKWGSVLLSVLLCVLGVLLLAQPDISASLLCRIGGALLVLFGLVKIIGYWSKDLYRLAFQYDLAFGILLLVLGVTLLVRTEAVLPAIWAFLGVCVLVDALLKIQIAIDARTFGIRRWWLILTTAILACMTGALLVLHPSESGRAILILLGIALLFEGILNFVTILTAVKILRSRRPDVVDAEYFETIDDR